MKIWRRGAKAFWRFHHAQRGLTLLETVISTIVMGTGLTAAVGMMAVGTFAGEQLTNRSSGILSARSQMEFILGEPYQEDGVYGISPDIPAGFEVLVIHEPIEPGGLQKINVVALRPGAVAEEQKLQEGLTTLKSNRIPASGVRPPLPGLESERAISIPNLARRTGFFQTVDVISVRGSQVVARWQLISGEPTEHTSDRKQLSITIYVGTPFGLGTGISSTDPEAVSNTVIGQGSTRDVVLRVTSQKVTTNTFTVYFHNDEQGGQPIVIAKASIACVCPG